jgi:hypothetical protein
MALAVSRNHKTAQRQAGVVQIDMSCASTQFPASYVYILNFLDTHIRAVHVVHARVPLHLENIHVTEFVVWAALHVFVSALAQNKIYSYKHDGLRITACWYYVLDSDRVRVCCV